MELEGKKGQDTSTNSESEGYIADDETRPGPTVMQKFKERAIDYENHLKGKESTDKEDPHPELAYIPPGDGNDEAVADFQQGKQHGGSPVAAALGTHVPGGARTHSAGEGADKPTTMEKIKEKFWEAENHMKGKETSAVEDPHPELAYIPPMPQEEKPGFFSRMEHKFGGQKEEIRGAAAAPMESNQGVQPAPEVQAANKGVGSNELGTGYEEDGESDTINPAVVPKYDEGVKPLYNGQEAGKGFGSSEVGTGYEGGSEGDLSDFSISKPQGKEPKFDSATNSIGDIYYDTKTHALSQGAKQAARENETKSGDETQKKTGFFSRVLGGGKQDS